MSTPEFFIFSKYVPKLPIPQLYAANCFANATIFEDLSAAIVLDLLRLSMYQSLTDSL